MKLVMLGVSNAMFVVSAVLFANLGIANLYAAAIPVVPCNDKIDVCRETSTKGCTTETLNIECQDTSNYYKCYCESVSGGCPCNSSTTVNP